MLTSDYGVEQLLGSLFVHNVRAFWNETKNSNPSGDVLALRAALFSILFHASGLEALGIADKMKSDIAKALGVNLFTFSTMCTLGNSCDD